MNDLECDNQIKEIKARLKAKTGNNTDDITPGICAWFGGNMGLVDALIRSTTPGRLVLFSFGQNTKIENLTTKQVKIIKEVITAVKESDPIFQEIIDAAHDKEFGENLLNWANPDASITNHRAADQYLLTEKKYKETHLNKFFQAYVYFTNKRISWKAYLRQIIKERIPPIPAIAKYIKGGCEQYIEKAEAWFLFAWIALSISTLSLALPSLACAFLSVFNQPFCKFFPDNGSGYILFLFNSIIAICLLCLTFVAFGMKSIGGFDRFLIIFSEIIYLAMSIVGCILQQKASTNLLGFLDIAVLSILLGMIVVFCIFLFRTPSNQDKSFIPIIFLAVLFFGLAQIALGFPFRYIQVLTNVLIFSALAFVSFHQAFELTKNQKNVNEPIKKFLHEIATKDYLLSNEIRGFFFIWNQENDDKKRIGWQSWVLVIILFGFGVSLFFNLFSTQVFSLNTGAYILYPSWMADRDFEVFYVIKSPSDTMNYILLPSVDSPVYASKLDTQVATSQVEAWKVHTLSQPNVSQGFWEISVNWGGNNTQKLSVQHLKIPFGIRGYLQSQPFFIIAGFIYGVILTLLQLWVGTKANSDQITQKS